MLPNHQLYKQNFSKPYNCTEEAILKIQYNDEEIYPVRKTLLASDGAGGWDRIRVLLPLLSQSLQEKTFIAKKNGRQNNLSLGTDKSYTRSNFQKPAKGEDLLNLSTPPHKVWVHDTATIIPIAPTFQYLYHCFPLNPDNHEFVQWAFINCLSCAGIMFHDLEGR